MNRPNLTMYLLLLMFFAICTVSYSFHVLLNRLVPLPRTIDAMKIQQQTLRMSTDTGNVAKGVNDDSDDDDDDDDDEKPKPFKGFSKKKEEEIATKEVKKTKEEILADQRLESQIRSTNMFEKKRAREEAELDAKIAAVREEEELIASDPSVGAVPEIVANRMLNRMIVFFGVPVFGGLAIFVGAFFYSKKYDLVVPPSIIAYATQAPFVLGLVGITYSILSSSWDPEVPGSALGFEEAKTNFKRITEGVDRTRKQAELKDEIEKEKKKLGRK